MVEQEASTAAKSNAESQVRVDTLFAVLAGITEPQFFKTRERLPIFIAIYGMFIPSNWRRMAILTSATALIPTIAAFFLRQYYPELKQVDGFPSFIAFTMTMVMALSATLAVNAVHRIRREVATAKQYGQYHLLEEIGRGGMPNTLHRNLLSTNAIENSFRNTRNKLGRVTRFRAETDQATRWLAFALLEVEKGFRRISGHKDMPKLIAALERKED